jgi:hypothetical protein
MRVRESEKNKNLILNPKPLLVYVRFDSKDALRRVKK